MSWTFSQRSQLPSYTACDSRLYQGCVVDPSTMDPNNLIIEEPVFKMSMPIPKAIAVFNKHVTNRLFILFAGWMPPLAIVKHRGRNSGRGYRTPVMAFPTDNGFVFALTYGRDVDWLKNLLASDIGTLEYNGEEIEIHNIRHASCVDVKEVFPLWIRLPLSVISVEHCIIVEGSAQNSRPDPSQSN